MYLSISFTRKESGQSIKKRISNAYTTITAEAITLSLIIEIQNARICGCTCYGSGGTLNSQMEV